MKPRTRIALAALVLALFGAALAAIWVATEPGPSRSRAAPGAELAADAVTPLASTAAAGPGALPPLPGPGATPPPEWRKANPTTPAPVPNATPPVAGPPPRGLPADPAAREDAILDVRRRRFAEQMERMNRRNAQRGGVPADAGARPPGDKPRPGDRRGSLSTTE